MNNITREIHWHNGTKSVRWLIVFDLIINIHFTYIKARFGGPFLLRAPSLLNYIPVPKGRCALFFRPQIAPTVITEVRDHENA